MKTTSINCCHGNVPCTSFSHIALSIFFSDEPQPQSNLQQIKIFTTKNTFFVKLSWNVPNDGGSPILKYIVEFKPVGVSWATANKLVVNDTACLMTLIEPRKAYGVRVFAMNKVNISKPSNVAQVTLGKYGVLISSTNVVFCSS